MRLDEVGSGEEEGREYLPRPVGAEEVKSPAQHSDMNKFVQLFREGTGMLTIGGKIGYVRKCGDAMDEADLLGVQMDFEDGINRIIKRILARQGQ